MFTLEQEAKCQVEQLLLSRPNRIRNSPGDSVAAWSSMYCARSSAVFRTGRNGVRTAPPTRGACGRKAIAARRGLGQCRCRGPLLRGLQRGRVFLEGGRHDDKAGRDP